MLIMLLIGWIVLLPAIVVVGLYVSSSVLGRRRAALGVYEDLLVDEQTEEADVAAVTPEAITGPLASAPARRPPVTSDASAPKVPPVGAGY
ncbi:MAG TPA: hypothetical protein VGL69_22905 [Solirubrobacteraceae bacterium]|jgi:hypothetical protein